MVFLFRFTMYRSSVSRVNLATQCYDTPFPLSHFRFPLSAEFQRDSVLSGGTQRCTLPHHHERESGKSNISILLEWKSNPHLAFTVKRLSPSPRLASVPLFKNRYFTIYFFYVSILQKNILYNTRNIGNLGITLKSSCLYRNLYIFVIS